MMNYMKNVSEDIPKDQMFGDIVFPFVPLLFQDEIGGKLYFEDENGDRIEYEIGDKFETK